MATILCTDDGATPTRKDLDTVEEFRRFLERVGPPPGHVGAFFDGDLATVCPNFADRDKFVIVDGQLQVAPR